MRTDATVLGDCSYLGDTPRVIAMKMGPSPSAWVAMLLCLAGGCGGNSLETVPVRGRATLDGHDWPKPGRLFFLPTEPRPGFPRRPGLANFGVDGRFRAGSFSEGDGLVPGTYAVRIECWEIPPTMESSRPPKSYLPASYMTPQWTLKVESGSKPIEVEYNVSTKSRS